MTTISYSNQVIPKVLFEPSGKATFSGDVTVSDGTNDMDIASRYLNGLKLGGVLVTATAAELSYPLFQVTVAIAVQKI